MRNLALNTGERELLSPSLHRPDVAFLGGSHDLNHFSLHLCFARSRVGTAMAIGAERDDRVWMIRPTIAQALNVVRLEIRRSILSVERSRIAIVFTASVCSREDIFSDNAASQINIEQGWSLSRVSLRSLNGKSSQVIKSVWYRNLIDLNICRRLFNSFVQLFQRNELENNRFSHVAVLIRRHSPFQPTAHIFAQKTKLSFFVFEQKQALPVLAVLVERLVSVGEFHVAKASGAEILERLIWQLLVMVSVAQTLLTSNGEHYRGVRWSDYSTLLLSVEPRVNVVPAIIDLPALKTPSHVIPHIGCNPFLLTGGCGHVKEQR